MQYSTSEVFIFLVAPPENLVVASTAQILGLYPDAMGRYDLVSGQTQNNGNVWKNAHKEFFIYRFTDGVWHIGADVAGAGDIQGLISSLYPFSSGVGNSYTGVDWKYMDTGSSSFKFDDTTFSVGRCDIK